MEFQDCFIWPHSWEFNRNGEQGKYLLPLSSENLPVAHVKVVQVQRHLPALLPFTWDFWSCRTPWRGWEHGNLWVYGGQTSVSALRWDTYKPPKCRQPKFRALSRESVFPAAIRSISSASKTNRGWMLEHSRRYGFAAPCIAVSFPNSCRWKLSCSWVCAVIAQWNRNQLPFYLVNKNNNRAGEFSPILPWLPSQQRPPGVWAEDLALIHCSWALVERRQVEKLHLK